MKTDRQLAMILGDFIDRRGQGDNIAAVRTFGLEMAADLAHLTRRQCEDLCEAAGINRSLGAELHDAVREAPGGPRTAL